MAMALSHEVRGLQVTAFKTSPGILAAMLWGGKKLRAPDRSFELTYPKDWVCEAEDSETYRLRRADAPIGTLRVTPFSIEGSPTERSMFLDEKEKEFRIPLKGETKVTAVKRMALEPFMSKDGLFRMAIGEEDGIPVVVSYWLWCGRTSAVTATYVAPNIPRAGREGEHEFDVVSKMMLKMIVR